MKKLSILISLVLTLMICSGCGKEKRSKNNGSLSTSVSPVMVENAIHLAGFFVSSISLSQKMLQRGDAVDAAVSAERQSEICSAGGSVDYTFTSGAYPVTVTLDQCADDRSTMSGTLRFDSSEKNRSIDFLSDLNVSHSGNETTIFSGTVLRVSVSANNSDNQDIYLSVEAENNGIRMKSIDMIFVNLFQDKKNYALYDGNITIDQNTTFAYYFPNCENSSAVCVPSPPQVYNLDNGILSAGEGSSLYFQDEFNNSAYISQEEINSLQIWVYDSGSGSSESKEVDVSGLIF